MFVALSVMAFAQQWTGIGKSNPAKPEVKLISSSEQQVVVDFSLSGFYLTRVETPEGTQHIVSVPKMPETLEAGTPNLPHFPVPVIIGDMAEMEVYVTQSEFTDYPGVEIAPSKGNFSRQIDPATVPYTYGEMYSQDAFYPAAQAYLEAPYIVRDFRGQNIMVTPFAYNPVTKTLRVYHNLTIEMKKVSDNGENPKLNRKKGTVKVAPEMAAGYSRRFINYGETAEKYSFTTEGGSMLVICPDQYVEAMSEFVAWKNQSGRPTTIKSISELGGNNANNFKSYIQELYNNPEENLTYILLVGDYADNTPHSMSGYCSDNWLCMLEGNDYYLEAFVGRFSVESMADLQNHINKVLYYERDIQADVDWLDMGVGIGSTDGATNGHNGGNGPEADYVHIDYIRDTLLHYTYDDITRRHSGVTNPTASQLSQDFNAGKGMVNYCNHGSEVSWGVCNYSNSHVNALTNDYMWPFVVSVACLNGKFNHSQPCFGETWMRATNNTTGAPTGAIGGMFSWISQPWTPPQWGQDEMNDILAEWRNGNTPLFHHTLGGIFLNGNEYILDAEPGDQGETHNSWILFGDPSLMFRSDDPTEMNAICNPTSLMLGMTSIEVNVENTAFGIATLSMDGEAIASGYVVDGTCTLNFPALNNVGIATMTIIGYNKVTEIIPVEIQPAEGPFVTIDNYTPNFAPVNMETSMSMTFKNVGVESTNGDTEVALTCTDDRMNIINGTASFPVLAVDETTTLANAFSFIVAEGVEDGTRFQIDVTMTDGRQTWSGKVFVTAGQANLDYVGTTWSGNYVPGETVTLVANFKNTGHYMATNAIATVACTSEYVTLLNPSIEIGTIDPEGVATCVFNLLIDANCPTSEPITVDFAMEADGGLTAEGSFVMKNSCGVVFSLSDSYGDGWNGNRLVVSFDDGTPQQELTISSGSTATYTLDIGNGVHVTLSWISGSYTSECSFTVRYESGELIYDCPSPSSSLHYEFDCNCGAGRTYDPVENLVAEVNDGNITLTWDAPEGAISFIVYRNGLQIGETAVANYSDVVYTEDYYSYCVVAEYSDGLSVPECIIAKAELGLEENLDEVNIYPNPVSNTLYISAGNTEIAYAMYNDMGQMVANGNAQGIVEINVDGMAKGVYFLRLTTGAQVRIEKVVVK